MNRLLYHITTHRHLEGVGLAKAGHWGGKRYPDDASAVRAIRDDAAGQPFSIERKSVTLRR